MIDFKIFWGPLIHAIGANAQVTQIPEFKICLQGQEICFQCKSTPFAYEDNYVYLRKSVNMDLVKLVTILISILSLLYDGIVSPELLFKEFT